MKLKKRIAALLMAGAMVCSTLPVNVLAVENSNQNIGGLCEHHTEHNADCGYTEGIEGTPCNHEHNGDCYTLVTECVHEHTEDCYPAESVSENTATPSDAEDREPTACTHKCSEESGCITKELDCRHEHDEDCGYTPATPGTPCTFVCEICKPEDSGKPTEPECICETLCTAEAVNGDCPVCSAEEADLTACKGTSTQEEMKCTCTVLCTEDAINTDCTVCSAEEADLTACKGTPMQKECTCTVPCIESAVNADCPICGAENADLTQCVGKKTDEQVKAVQEQIDALPTPEELAAMTAEEQQEVHEKLEAAYKAYNALTDEQKAQITGAEIFESLFVFFNGMTNALSTVNDVKYLDADGSEQTANNVTVVDSTVTSWSDGWYVVNGDVTIDNLIKVSGEVHLILADGCSLTVNGGINVAENNALTIYGQSGGTGVLTAQGDNGGAGIGGGENETGGNITINGGTVNATAGHSYNTFSAAGIGGGAFSSGGSITINGGTVTATGGNGGAGIGGGGDGDPGNGTGGNIIINGGMVTATGNGGGAGIGGGMWSSGGAIIITGGTVTSTGSGGAGIGAGEWADGGTFSTGVSGNALIRTESISDQTGKDGSWSGVIFEGENVYIGGNQTFRTDLQISENQFLSILNQATLTIETGKTLTNNGIIYTDGTINGEVVNSGTILVNSDGDIMGDLSNSGEIRYAKDIAYLDVDGTSKTMAGLTPVTFLTPDTVAWGNGWYVAYGDVTIDRRVAVTGDVKLVISDGCNLNATKGINVGENNSLTIYGQTACSGKLTANGGVGQAGIGGDKEQSGGAITIHGGKVVATGGGSNEGEGAGIGGGAWASGGAITITGGVVEATGGSYKNYGGAGIGGGYDGTGGSVTISGGTVTAKGSGWFEAGFGGAGIGAGGNSSDKGTFSTGRNGNAFIVVNNGIPDETNQADWSGVIFTGDNGQVYGSPALKEDATIPGGVTLTISAGDTLTIPWGVTVTNNGTIVNNSTLINNGNIIGSGTLTGSGSLTGSGTIADTVNNEFQKDSAVSVSVNPSNAAYGSTVAITATMSRATNTFTRAAANQVEFFVGTGSKKKSLGTANVVNNTATLSDVEISKETGFVTGENTITAEYGGSMGLKPQSGTATLTISKMEQTALQIADVSGKKYGDSPFTLTTTGGSGTGAVTFSVPSDNGVLTISGDQATIIGAGTVEVTANKAGDEDYNPATATLEITIGKAEQSAFQIVNVTGKKYGDASFTLTTTGGSGTGTVTFSVPSDNGVLTVSGDQATIIGTGTVEVTANKAGDDNYNPATTTLNITIGKGDAPAITWPTASAITYGKKVSDSTLTGGSTQYGAFTWSDDVKDTVPAAGISSYSVVFTPSADTEKNYETITKTKQDVSLTVNQRSLNSAQVTVSGSYTYTGQAQIPAADAVTVKLDGVIIPGDQYTISASSNTDAGQATVTVSGIQNYSGTASGTFTIDKATPTPDLPADLTAIYGSTLKDVSLPEKWVWDNPETSVGDVGNNTFPATYTKDNSGNYNLVQQILTVKVTPASYKITVTGQANSPTQITLNEAVVEPGNTGTTVTYGYNTTNDVPSNWQAERVFTGLTADTTYYFFAKAAANGNYAETISQGVAITTPEKAVDRIEVINQPANLSYTSGQTLDLSGLSIQVYYNDNTNETLTWDSGKLTAAPAQGTVLTVAEHDSKTISVSYGSKTAETDTLTVGKAAQTVLSITGAPTTIYNGDSFTLSLSGGSGTGAVTWSVVSGSATVDENGKVAVTGTGDFQIKAAKAADVEYNQAEAVITLTAVKKPSGGGGGSSSGGSGGSGDSSSNDNSNQPEDKPETPVTGETKPMQPDNSGNVIVDNSSIQSTIDKAKPQAGKNGVAVVIPITPAAGQTSFSVTIPAQTLDLLVREKVKRLEINIHGVAVEGMDEQLLKWLDTVSKGGDVILRVKRVDALSSTEAKAAIGTRPVYDLSLVYLSGGKEMPITTLGGHTISVRLPYIPVKGEAAGNLYAVYVDNVGKVEWITKSSYDASQKAVVFETGHFSVYGVGYKNPAPAFTDITGHWAADNILFASSRGLLSGTSDTTFSPNTGMTRGMFVTALGRLAGINPDSYKTGKFTDVKADAYYAPYVNWAVQTGIVEGVTSTTFAPDININREQMAVIMKNYAVKLGYDLPKTLQTVTFADNANISSWAKDAVKAMQQAGILAGKNGNQFDPKGTATRAEVATVLRRFVEIVIDPQAANGWQQNDSGQWRYYRNGEPVKGWLSDDQKWYWLDKATGMMFVGGWKQIDGKWYYFYLDGAMAVNTTIDGYTIGSDGARKD